MKRQWIIGLNIIWCILVCAFVHGWSQTLPPGPQVLTFFSNVDDTEQPYCIYIPPNFDETKQYPLVVMLHGAGSNHRLAMRRVFGKSNFKGENDVEASLYFPPWKDIDMIVAAPYARGTIGYQGFVEKDVMDMIADVKTRFPIDTNRMYLTGLSMGGGGTLWIGLSHPDLWAAINPVCPAPPQGTMELAPNALNMAVRFVHGDADQSVPVTVSRNWVTELNKLGSPVVEYEELPGVDHFSWVGAYKDGREFDWFSQYVRNPYPRHVRHAALDLTHGKAYWVRIDQKVPGETALIDAQFTSVNQLRVTTTNVEAFTLTLDGHPAFRKGEHVHLVIDDMAYEVIPLRSDISFSKDQNGHWQNALYRPPGLHKTAGLEGPVGAAFAQRHVYVYGTADNPSEDVLRARRDTALIAADWAKYRNEFLGRVKMFPRVVSDKEVRQSDYESANLILFGTAETNSVIARYADKLPMQLKPKAVDKYGLTCIFPDDYQHYVVICSGLPWWHAGIKSDSYYMLPEQLALGGIQDYLLFSKDLKTVVQGYFDAMWGLSDAQRMELEMTGTLK